MSSDRNTPVGIHARNRFIPSGGQDRMRRDFKARKESTGRDNVEVNSVDGGKGQDSEGSYHNLEIEARRLMDIDSIMLRE
jgi:hypothetical protein